MKKIIFKRKNNQGIIMLKILSLFRDKNIILSLEEISKYLKMYEDKDEIIIELTEMNLEKINELIPELDDEGVNYEVI